MKCSCFIATSVDGYIATADDSVEWLTTSGKQGVDLGVNADMGFNRYLDTVDCMIMGRKCLEKLASFKLSAEQWPYRDLRIIALSSSLSQVPEGLPAPIELYSGDIQLLVKQLEQDGFKHAYIDGGATITGFLNKQLLNEITTTQAPILLGSGKPLFGLLTKSVAVVNPRAVVYDNDFVQMSYTLNYHHN